MARASETAASGGAGQLPDTFHALLRRATRAWHEQVDAAFAAHDLASREGLSDFLVRQARVLAILEGRVEQCGAAAMLPDWASRKRDAALAADLAQLGSAAPPAIAVAPFRSHLHGFGALYVLEGSKLGARVLVRKVASSRDPEVRAAVRFLGHPNDGGWARFLAILNSLPQSADVADALQAGACTAFSAFLDAATAVPGPNEAGAGDRCTALSIPLKRETSMRAGEYAG